MGYESTLFIVNKTKLKIGSQPYGEVLAKINLCKTGYDFVSIFSGNYTMCNVYDADINHTTKTVDGIDFSLPVDKYDDVLTELPVKTVLDKMVELDKREDYRRFKMAIPMLQYFVDNDGDWPEGEIVVLHCGM